MCEKLLTYWRKLLFTRLRRKKVEFSDVRRGKRTRLLTRERPARDCMATNGVKKWRFSTMRYTTT